jgi:hypothetical protein
MASTYSDRLKLELMETGANANTWGNNTNTNLETLDAFTAGYLSKSVAGSANVTLTSNNADPTAEASNKVIEFSGALTGNIYVFIPAVENNYIFFNNTSGAYTLTIAPTGHSANGVVITQGAHTIMYNNANNEIKDLFSGSLGDLSLVSGGVFTGNASGASALNASNVSSGTIADARLTANVTLNNASTISAGTLADARLTANVTLNNASTISAGTLSNDRLDTVPTTKGGTGLTSVGSPGQVLTVTAPGTGLEFADAGGGGVGNVTTQSFTNPGTFTANADTQFVSIELVGGGGGGGGGSYRNYQTGASGGTGGTSNWGSLISATGGAGGAAAPNGGGGGGSGGAGSGNKPFLTVGGSGGGSGGRNAPVGSPGNTNPGPGGNAGSGNSYPGVGKGGNGGTTNSGSQNSGGGGGGGGAGVTFAVIGGPDYSPSVAYQAGAGGNPGGGSTRANGGQAGQVGRVKVTEYIS